MNVERRDFLRLTLAAGGGFLLAPGIILASAEKPPAAALLGPGHRAGKIRIGKVYLANPAGGHWPNPTLDLAAEREKYEGEFTRLAKPLAEVEFIGNTLVTSPEQAREAAAQFQDAEAILAVHLDMGIVPILAELLKAGKPTILFAAPYSGHEWTRFGAMARENPLFDAILTSDMDQLAAAIRPIRAIHQLREAKIINIIARKPDQTYLDAIREKFGTRLQVVGKDQTMEVFNSIDDAAARAEAKRWTEGATAVVEPNEDEIFRSCKLALAFEKLLAQEQADMLTVDCYGTMYHNLPAFPCIGLTRLEDVGLGGVCESDLRMAVTALLFRGLSGRPGFVSDPTVDAAQKSIILAHCRCATKMDGPEGEAAPYKLRTIMERQEGCVAQVQMRVGQAVTQASLVSPDSLIYFTGKVIEAPDVDRGCRTKITVQADGSIDRLWRNWTSGLHRLTAYGDLREDLTRFCKFKSIAMTDESA